MPEGVIDDNDVLHLPRHVTAADGAIVGAADATVGGIVIPLVDAHTEL